MVVRDQEGFELANTALKWKRWVIATAVKAAVLSVLFIYLLQLTCANIFHFPDCFEGF